MSSTIASVSRNSRAADGIRRPEQAEHADGEGDVGGHRDAPAVAAGPATRDEQVEPGRDEHAADRGHDGQRRRLGVAQAAGDELVLDLEPDHEEEDHHQGVVDPVLQRLLEPEAAEVDADRRCARTRRTTTPTGCWPRPAPRRRRGAAGSSPRPRCAGTRAPAGRRGAPAACCWRGTTGRSPRRRRRRRRWCPWGLLGMSLGMRHAAFRGRCQDTPRPRGHGPTRLPGTPRHHPIGAGGRPARLV